MVKANRSQIQQALRSLEATYKAVLLYGPDDGLVRERADLIAHQLVDDLNDPFRVARIGPDQLKATPSLLVDEMAAMSMTGGRRLVWLESGGDSHHAAISSALETSGDSLLVVTAGELPARSKLRKLFETDKHLLSIACYSDEGRDLIDLIRQMLEEAGLFPAPDALAWLAANLGKDRQVSRGELTKIILYKLSDTDKTVSLDDARACVGDAADMTLGQIAEAITGGEVERLDNLIEKAYIAGESPVALLRVIQNRFMRLHLVRGFMGSGLDAATAATKLSPPLFFKERDSFLNHVRRWPADRLSTALSRLMEAELACKSTGMPAETLTSRLCLQLAASVRNR